VVQQRDMAIEPQLMAKRPARHSRGAPPNLKRDAGRQMRRRGGLDRLDDWRTQVTLAVEH